MTSNIHKIVIVLTLLAVTCAVVLGLWPRKNEPDTPYANEISNFLEGKNRNSPEGEIDEMYFMHFRGVLNFDSLKRYKTYLNQVAQAHEVLAIAYLVSPSIGQFRILIFFRQEDQCYMSFLTRLSIEVYDVKIGCDAVDAAMISTTNWSNKSGDYKIALDGANFGFTAWSETKTISAYKFEASEVSENKEVNAEILLGYLLELSKMGWDFVEARDF